jgi:hypothetical protein
VQPQPDRPAEPLAIAVEGRGQSRLIAGQGRRRRRFMSLLTGSAIVRLPNQISGKSESPSTGAKDFVWRQVGSF